MASGFTRVQKQNAWEKWNRKMIYADAGVRNIAPRHQVIRHFMERGVFPFVRARGYVFYDSVQTVTNSFLRYLFALHVGEKVHFENPHQDEDICHFEEFEHRFDTMEMEDFWEKWGSIEDFSDGHYAEDVKYTITFFIWASINLINSPAYIKLERVLDELDQMENMDRKDTKGKEDPYLQESSKYNYEDKHY